MIAFIGLGNIGDVYANTKHNAGFWVIDELARRNNLSFIPGEGDYVYSQLKRNKVLLIKPTTMMNKSGVAVKNIICRWNLLPSEIFIILDDVDLPLGSIRIRPKGGDGCHRGLENIIYQLKTNQFPRIRLGIADFDYQRPSEKYVLKPFNRNNIGKVEDIIKHCADAVQYLLIKGIERTMNKFNTKLKGGSE